MSDVCVTSRLERLSYTCRVSSPRIISFLLHFLLVPCNVFLISFGLLLISSMVLENFAVCIKSWACEHDERTLGSISGQHLAWRLVASDPRTMILVYCLLPTSSNWSQERYALFRFTEARRAEHDLWGRQEGRLESGWRGMACGDWHCGCAPTFLHLCERSSSFLAIWTRACL